MTRPAAARLLVLSLLVALPVPALAGGPLPATAATTATDDFVARMEREHAGDRPLASPAAETEPAAPVSAGPVDYAVVGEQAVAGYLARPEGAEGPLPGVILIHEWWGLNDNIRAVARRLAGEGYAALAVDLYGGEAASDRETAARLARAAGERPADALANLRAATTYLEQRLGAPRIGVVGWCFGGGWSLRAALDQGPAIDAAVIYYGRLVTGREELAALEAPVLGLFGALDGGIPVSAVREFQHALEGLGKTASIHVYEDADHAFANPSGGRYNATAAEDAWAKTLAFFDRHLRP